MSDRMTPIPLEQLLTWALREHRNEGSAFGVSRFYRKNDDKCLSIFGERLDTPFGPAAGPHTQLAQNILAAYLAGCRFFELKTVQILDGEELAKCVLKPCILAEDEAYNCEWSTELTVEDAFGEYVKAYFLIQLLSREWGLGYPDGFVFNMSVGYDLAGIQTPKIDGFIEGMKNAANTAAFQECLAAALRNLHRLPAWDEESVRAISPRICRSITLSTLHGCPPEEIERIATYLIAEKGLHTFVKCNPTLLGYDFARETLDAMGYGYMAFDDRHFREDLQYRDAVPMFRRLQTLARERELTFGVKLTNTFPVDVTQKELPSDEMYMSGRPLFALTTALAARLSREFKGQLRISFSGGADAFNICQLFQCGIWPITVATTLLKPGGYQRALQLAQRLSEHAFEPFYGVDVEAIEALSQSAVTDPHYIKPVKPLPPRKLSAKVPFLDCFTAPCKGGCPIGQDVPEYVELVGKGKNREALGVIIEKNPLPFITGTICPHHCMEKCTRNFYETPVRIREAKLTAARNAFYMVLGELKTPPKTANFRAAIVGGGPAGIAAAYFLGRAGVAVTLYEKKGSLGGVVRYVIPSFRIKDYAIDQDVQLMERMGVQVELNTPAPTVAELKEKGYGVILLAVGAGAHGHIPMFQGKSLNVIEFLEQFKKDPARLNLGRNVVVVGGGNTAMDAARAAKRVPGVEKVRIVYRRTQKYMPADEEEWELAAREGVEFLELLQPREHFGGVLVCMKNRLGDPDESGRRRPVETEETVDVPCDSIIAAVGERLDGEFFRRNGLDLNIKGLVDCDPETLETAIPGVYLAGDALRGPSTVVEAIADAQRFVNAVVPADRTMTISANALVEEEEARAKKGVLRMPKRTACENTRCLNCSTLCECCADVCPNRANIPIQVPGKAMRQILHIDRMCNECGNCRTFCPYDSAPYLEKPTLFHTQRDFEDSKNEGFLVLDAERRLVRTRLSGQVRDVNLTADQTGLSPEIEALILTVLKNYEYLL